MMPRGFEPTLASAPMSFQDAFDLAFPDFVNSAFDNVGNNNNCVIAARAHHTIRLAWTPGGKILAIDDSDVNEEFVHEGGGSGSAGLILGDSLAEWTTRGWTAGGVGGRIIDDFGALDVDAIRHGDVASELTWQEFQTRMAEHSGIQSQLLLPPEINGGDDSTFGPKNPRWTDTEGPRFLSHTMLLTGYDAVGPMGITWGQKQRMSWPFLQKYCVALFWVQKGDRT